MSYINMCYRNFLRRTLAAYQDLVVSRVASNTHAGWQLRRGWYYFYGALARNVNFSCTTFIHIIGMDARLPVQVERTPRKIYKDVLATLTKKLDNYLRYSVASYLRQD